MRVDHDLDAWLRQQKETDDARYEQYGKELEETHSGAYLAIGPDGEIIVGDDDMAVLEQAVAHFGPGNFTYRRVGHAFTTRWLGVLTHRD